MAEHSRQTVVVAGASGGIGRATAERLASRGANVALLARGETGLDAADEAVRLRGGISQPIPLDLADPKAIDAAADQGEAEFGPIDIWVNVAMTSVFAPFLEIEPEEFRRVTDVTYH